MGKKTDINGQNTLRNALHVPCCTRSVKFLQISSQLERLTNEKQQQSQSSLTVSGDGWGDDGWGDFSTGSDERLEELKKQNEVLNQELDDLRALNVSGNCAHLTQLLTVGQPDQIIASPKLFIHFPESEENKELRTQLLETKNQLDDYYTGTVEELQSKCSELEEKCRELQTELDEVRLFARGFYFAQIFQNACPIDRYLHKKVLINIGQSSVSVRYGIHQNGSCRKAACRTGCR